MSSLNFLNVIVKEIYKQWFIYRQFGGIRTMEYTRTLCVIIKHYNLRLYGNNESSSI